MLPITITNDNFEEQVMKSSKTVLLDFWAGHCRSCRAIAPIIDEIAAEHNEFIVGKINVDEQQELAVKFRIMSIPALFVIKNGKIITRSVGAKSKGQILEMLQ